MTLDAGALVDTERADHVLVIRMVRAATRNAVNRGLADAIDAALNELDDNPDLWVGAVAAMLVL